MESVAPKLSVDPPLLYAITSGSTGEPKYIPLVAEGLRALKVSQNIFAYAQYRSVAGAYAGRLLGIVSPAIEGQTEQGKDYGSASGHIFRNMPALAQRKYVVPYPVLELEDYELKYLLILRLALNHVDITYMGSDNPSTFLRLMEVLSECRQQLLADVLVDAFRSIRGSSVGCNWQSKGA